MLLSFIWIIFLSFSCISATITGKISLLTGAALEGAQQGVTVTMAIAGSVCLWSALTEVMEKSGLMQQVQKFFHSFLQHLFPCAAQEPAILGAISANLTANLLGLGNAATPSGIRAVRLMQKQSGQSAPTDEMCRLIVMNTASVQLIPTTVAAIRAAAGAAQPFDILPAVWCASLLSVLAGLLSGEICRRLRCSRIT